MPSLPPPPEELRAGTLAELPAPRLLALAAQVRMAGRLDLEGEVARSLWFEGGRVVGATSADPAERIEAPLQRRGHGDGDDPLRPEMPACPEEVELVGHEEHAADVEPAADRLTVTVSSLDLRPPAVEVFAPSGRCVSLKAGQSPCNSGDPPP